MAMLSRADRLVVASDEGAKFGGLERRIPRISRAPAAGPHPHLLSFLQHHHIVIAMGLYDATHQGEHHSHAQDDIHS